MWKQITSTCLLAFATALSIGCGDNDNSIQSGEVSESIDTEIRRFKPLDAESKPDEAVAKADKPATKVQPVEPKTDDPTDRAQQPVNLLQPDDLTYQGAFRLPVNTSGSNWEYSGYAMTYYASGDPDGPADGYPGSIYAVGHDHHQMVSEINIPVPVKSSGKNLADLSVAQTLQPFADITNAAFGELEIPRAGIEYLPAPDGEPGKIYFCWGQHLESERSASHGWSELNLSSPQPAGPWRLGDLTNYVTNDYLFEIPELWAARYTPGKRLITGRFRDGHWSGRGPALLAYGPPDATKPPAPQTALKNITPLVMYGENTGALELAVSDDRTMNGFSEADEWSGGAWLTAGDRSAVALVGTHATGKTWYGFGNGVVYPTSGEPGEVYPEVPPWPYDARGWWSEGIESQIIFFNPRNLADVARGLAKTWEPQPYATLKLDQYLFDPVFDHQRQKRYLLGAACFDRDRGILYIAERRVLADEERSLIHVFKVAAP